MFKQTSKNSCFFLHPVKNSKLYLTAFIAEIKKKLKK